MAGGDIVCVILPAILSAQKENPPEINDFRGFVVAGAVLPGLWPSECHFGGALLKETLSRCAPSMLFYSRAYKP